MRLDAADAPAVDDDVDVLPDGIGLTRPEPAGMDDHGPGRARG